LIINKSEIEVLEFLRCNFKNPISTKSFLGETFLYNLNFDDDQFTITKLAKPFRKNGLLEVHAHLKISGIDDNNSKLLYSLRFSDFSILLIVIMNLIFILVPHFVTNFRLFGEHMEITSFSGKITFTVIGVVLSNCMVWISFLIKKSNLQKIVDLLIHAINNDAATLPKRYSSGNF
jgi:hypothetical protein